MMKDIFIAAREAIFLAVSVASIIATSFPEFVISFEILVSNPKTSGNMTIPKLRSNNKTLPM